MERRNNKPESNIFNLMIDKAQTIEEKEGFEKMISMMLTSTSDYIDCII